MKRELLLIAAAVFLATCGAGADVYVKYDGSGTPEVFSAALKKAQLTPDSIQAGFVIEKPGGQAASFEYVGRDGSGNWLMKVRKAGETQWYVPDAGTAVFRKMDAQMFKDLKEGDVLIKPNLYNMDMRYEGRGEGETLLMKVLNNYGELGVPMPGDTLVTTEKNGALIVLDGMLTYDKKWPLKRLQAMDYCVVVGYLVLMIIIGIVVAPRNKSASDYFKGGGHTPWWLAGVSLFMTGFSTYTFVGGAGMAFERIWAALLSYFANLSAYVLGYAVLAARWRRTRALTTMEYLEERYDNPTHQLFSGTDVLIGFFYAAAQLLSLVAITGGAMGLDKGQMYWAILIIGFVTLFYTVAGGFWAVVMTDMLQFVVLFPIVLVAAWVCLAGVGGFGPILQRAPAQFWNFTSPTFNATVLVCNMVTMLFAFSSGGAAQRYFAVRNESGARKVAVLTAVLSVVGPLVWFVPPMVASYLYQTHDMTMVRLIPGFPIRESAYILMCRRILPPGLIGLVLAAMFAATMSSIDTSFNFRGAILTRDILKKYLFPAMSDHALLRLGKIITGLIGVVVIGLTMVMYAYGKSMFNIMFTIGGKILLPCGIPIVFGLLVKNTKRWTGFACLAVGLVLGIAEYGLTVAGAPVGEWKFMKQEWQILWIGCVVLAIYFLPGWISPYRDPEYQSRLDAFWKKMHTPINEQEELGPSTVGMSSFALTGILTIIIGVGVLVLYPFNRDVLTLVTAGMTIVFGVVMWYAERFAAVKE